MVSPTLYRSQHISPHHRTKLKSFKIIAYNHESPLNFYTNAHMKNMLYYAADDYFNVLIYCCVEDAGCAGGVAFSNAVSILYWFLRLWVCVCVLPLQMCLVRSLRIFVIFSLMNKTPAVIIIVFTCEKKQTNKTRNIIIKP